MNSWYHCPECDEYLSEYTDIDKSKLPMKWFECDECGWNQLRSLSNMLGGIGKE
jgi:hypothetical protein